ncbi:calcium-binding protein [Microcoleus sp. FACHB-672]|uniref:calcium-binding protein n=1 Tax=Microcoleus sp. FACHB-672 TaxID=2692825 RepID=UPI00168717A0|nr:calcium-binding protein [Microcoleus sp. FACHB-672]MBD2043584.1 calcium-binding protein [Microcoleus sp. FACHB-672]
MSASAAVYESLAKSIVYVDDNPQFQSQVQGFLAATGYTIDRVFDDPQTGLHAIGLVSATPDRPPVLVFRGADSPVDDIALSDARGVGVSQIQANQEALQSWLTEISQDTTKNPNQLLAQVMGHSLGGALAQTAAAVFTPLIGGTITFNSPGVNQTAVSAFIQQGGSDKPVVHYIVNGDFVSLSGQAFLPGQVILQSFTDPNINPLIVRTKHRVEGLLSTPPAGYSEREISAEELNNPSFSFTNDPDFQEFAAAMSVALPQLVTPLSSRLGAESLRVTPGFSYLGLLNQIDTALDLSQNNYLDGYALNNTVLGLEGNDIVIGDEGNDTLNGNQADDILSGAGRDDILYGGQNNDALFGNLGTDYLSGDLGNDSLYGGKGSDTLIGSEGDDILRGESDSDFLTGGSGFDQFVLAVGEGTDTIIDFIKGEDLLALSGGLTFRQLVIAAGENSTLIASNGQFIANVVGIDPSSISESDFIQI